MINKDSTMTSTSTALPLRSGTWTVDPAHTNIEFTIRHLGISKVRGRFNRFDASLTIGDTIETSSVEATVELSSVDTNNADRDAHLRSTDFFGTDDHPTMTFRSTGVADQDGDYRLLGDLTINGTTKPLALDVEFNGVEHYPLDQKDHAGFSATATIARSDFGIDFDVPLGVDKLAIGDKVRVEIEIQFVEPN